MGRHLVTRVRRFRARPKRKVIRVESEETQDYVREALNLSRDEGEELSFVPCAISIPQRPMFWCDNQCSDKALGFWQGIIHDQFMPEMLQRFSKLAVETVRGAKGAPWKALENDGKRTLRARNAEKRFRQEYKVTGSWSRQPKSTWSKLNAMMGQNTEAFSYKN